MFKHLKHHSQSVGNCVNNTEVLNSNPQGATFPCTKDLSSRNWKTFETLTKALKPYETL